MKKKETEHGIRKEKEGVTKKKGNKVEERKNAERKWKRLGERRILTIS